MSRAEQTEKMVLRLASGVMGLVCTLAWGALLVHWAEFIACGPRRDQAMLAIGALVGIALIVGGALRVVFAMLDALDASEED